jgi:DNA-binding response OmpR family regulator
MKKVEGKVILVSKDWKIRSYLKAELRECNIESISLASLREITSWLKREEPLVLFLDCKGENLAELKDLKKFRTSLILLDPEEEVSSRRILRRPITIGECLKEILAKLR